MNVVIPFKERKKFLITTFGETEADVKAAFEEAVRRIRAGNMCGKDSNETGAFDFEVTDLLNNTPTKPWRRFSKRVGVFSETFGYQTEVYAPEGFATVLVYRDPDAPVRLFENKWKVELKVHSTLEVKIASLESKSVEDAKTKALLHFNAKRS